MLSPYHTLKDEIPKLKATHTRAMSFFKGIKSGDVDDYVLVLKDEEIRAQFEIAFKRFAKQMNIILPDTAASPFVANLTFLGKVNNAARLRYRDEQLNIADAGEKVRQLVDEHILSTGVDPKIAPIDLLAANFKESVNEVKSPESRASEIESAIKHHITVNLDEDPEYYKSLSLRLRDIIEKNHGKWEQQVELLLELTDNIEAEHKKAADDLGLSETEYAFYNILVAEVSQHQDDEFLDDTTHEAIKATTQELVGMFDEATEIVDFFNKQDEIKRMKKAIKRAVIAQPFGDTAIVKAVKLKQGRLVVTVPDKQVHMIRNALIRGYKNHAQLRFQDKVNRYARIVDIEPPAIGIRTFKSRWGSCSAKDHIDFNWKIIMAPHHIVDYVVVHELCHLKQHDHSPKFWKLVERVIPDYADCKQWLKDNERLFIL